MGKIEWVKNVSLKHYRTMNSGLELLMNNLCLYFHRIIEYIKHSIAIIITLGIIFPFVSLINNWQDPFILAYVKILKFYLDKYGIIVESLMGLVIFIIIDYLLHVYSFYDRGKLARNAGLFNYIQNKMNKQAEDFIKAESKNSDNIYIMAASGFDTFTKEDSPLHEHIKNCPAEVRVILLHPESQAVKERAKHLKIDEKKYKETIDKSIKFLTDERNTGTRKESFHLKAYKSYPFWKLIILVNRNYLWLQQYPDVKNVQDSNGYVFRKIIGSASVYEYFYALFKKRWDSDKLLTYNFDTKKWASKINTGSAEIISPKAET